MAEISCKVDDGVDVRVAVQVKVRDNVEVNLSVDARQAWSQRVIRQISSCPAGEEPTCDSTQANMNR